MKIETAAGCGMVLAAVWMSAASVNLVREPAPAVPQAIGCADGPIVRIPISRQGYAGPGRQFKWFPLVQIHAEVAGRTDGGGRYRICAAAESTGWRRTDLWVQLQEETRREPMGETAVHWILSRESSLDAFVEKYLVRGD